MPCFNRREAPLETITASQAKEKDNFGHLLASSKNVPGPRPHDEHVAPKGASSEEWFGLVHTPIDIPKALTIPEARAALEKEWAKLVNPKRPAWDVTRVRPKAEVIAESERTGKPVHFGSLRDLCHIKNSQLGKKIGLIRAASFLEATSSKTKLANLPFSPSKELRLLTWLLPSSWMRLHACQAIAARTLTL